jgi:hypothetical protein
MSIDHARRFPDNFVKSFDTLCVFLETNNKRLISLRTLFMYKYESYTGAIVIEGGVSVWFLVLLENWTCSF